MITHFRHNNAGLGLTNIKIARVFNTCGFFACLRRAVIWHASETRASKRSLNRNTLIMDRIN